MHFRTRVVARVVALTTPALVLFALAGAARADAPATWEDGGGGLSTLDALLIFGGIPLALFVVIALLASTAKGGSPSHYRADQRHDSAVNWFGAPEPVEGVDTVPELTGSVKPGGGASASW